MLSFLRRVPTWVLAALFAVIAAAFIITGIGGGFGGGSVGDGAVVAEVGDAEITSGDVAMQFDRRLQQVRAENPELTAQDAVEAGALRAVLDQLIYSVGLAEFASDIGLSTSKRLVDADIASMEAFRGPTGVFDESTYRQVLQRQNIDERMLRRDLEGDVLRRHLLSVVADPLDVPEGVAEPFARRQLEQRTLRVAALPYAMFEVEDPTAEELAQFYEANVARFTIPERRRFRYVMFDRAELAENIEISEDEVEDFYEQSDDLYGGSERRALRQIVVQDEEQAAEIARRARAGEDLAAIGADLLDYTPEDVELGTMGAEQLAGTVNQDVASAVFAADQGAVVGPLESDFGYHVIAVDGVQAESAQPLATVAPEIRERLRQERASEVLADRVNAVQDALDDGASLGDVAEELGLELRTPPALTQAGRTPDDSGYQVGDDLRPVLSAAFELQEGDEPVIEQIGEGRFALVGLEGVVPAAAQPLEDIREEVERAYIARNQIEMAQERGEEIAEAVRGGANLASLLEDAGVPPAQELTARRVELAAQQGQLPNYIALGFVQDEGDIATVPFPEQGVQIIVETTDVTEGDLADAPNFLGSIRSQLRTVQQNELQLAFAAAVRDELGVESDPGALAALETRYRTNNAPVQ